MSAQDPMGPGDAGGPQGPDPDQMTEEELRAAFEEEMRRITVDQILLQSVVNLINLAGRRLGLAPDSEGEKDLDQVRTAIDAVRALLPVLETKIEQQDAAQLRSAVSQLQMAYAQEVGGAAPGEAPPAPGQAPPKPDDEPPQQGGGRSSGLWVPGQ